LVKYVINGGKPLNGEICISGAKNAASAILPAALLVDGVCRIENIPEIHDVTLLLEMMEVYGARVRLVNASTVEVDASRVRNAKPPYELMRQIRASYYFAGVMLSRFGRAHIALPGGCDIGSRPIDQHLKGFKTLGAQIGELEDGYISADSGGRPTGATVFLDIVSVGATINTMLAAVLAKGLTVIENPAKEPHVVDLANFLNSMGADVKGAGTDIIKIRGVDRLIGGTYSIIPDQIEAGTYMAAVTAAGGSLLIKNVIPKHLECITGKLIEVGAQVEEYDDSVRVSRTVPISRANVKTLPYPGFPTDLQPQVMVALSLAQGTSVVTESIWDNRYKYVDELIRMGANIQIDGKTAVVEGVKNLTGAPVRACDLRAGAAMVIAGICASGTTEIEDAHYIERGYENIVDKLRAVGVDIREVEVPDRPAAKEAL